MVQTNSIAEIEQNTQISFEKGVILHNCQLFSVPVANGETTIDNLMRGQQITVNSVYIMNGIKYLSVTVIGNDTEHTGFVLAGEVTEKLYPSEGSTINESGNVTGKDNTTLAGMIILLSTATFITTIFVILIKKDYIKL